MTAIQAGRFQVEPMITHRFPFRRAKEAYDLLHDRAGEALGVLLTWD